MKVKTAGGLAVLGMMLTSVSVWSLTNPRADLSPDESPLTLVQQLASSTNPAVFTAGQTLMMEGRLGHAALRADQDNETLLFLNVSGAKSEVQAKRSPLNLAIVIDRSGSMRGARLNNALSAARTMVSRLSDGDVVSIVSYNQQTQVDVPPTTVDSFSRSRVLRGLSNIRAEGDTCISCGIDAGMAQLRRRNGMVDRMLLLSDGEATAGVRTVSGFRSLASSVRNMGASITSIGVDVDYNERVMSALALESNGRHHFVEAASSLPKIFDQELASLEKTVAKNAEVAIELAPGVRVERVFDRTFSQQGNQLRVPLGSFSQGEQKTVLVRLRLPRGAAGERPIAAVNMNYADLVRGAPGSCSGKLATQLVADPSQVSALDPLVATRLTRTETAQALKDANKLFAQGRTAEARRQLDKRLKSVRSRRAFASKAAPKPKKLAVGADFDKQEKALESAASGFAPPPAGAPSPVRKGKAQVRSNAEAATDFAF